MKKMMVIEPHPDDLLISAHELLVSLVDKVEFSWVAMTSPRELRAYPESLGVREIHELDLSDDGKRDDAKLYYRKYMVSDCAKHVTEYFLQNPHYQGWVKSAAIKLNDLVGAVKPEIILAPVGIKHITHILTTHVLNWISLTWPEDGPLIWYYVEHPYASMVSGKFMKDDIVLYRPLVKFQEIARDQDECVALLRKYYPSEWMFAKPETFAPIEIFGS